MTHNHAAWRHQHRNPDCDGCRVAYNARALGRAGIRVVDHGVSTRTEDRP